MVRVSGGENGRSPGCVHFGGAPRMGHFLCANRRLAAVRDSGDVICTWVLARTVRIICPCLPVTAETGEDGKDGMV